MKKKKIIIIAALVLLLAGAAAAVFFMRGKGGEEIPPEVKEDPIVKAPIVYEVEKNTVIALPAGDKVTVREHKPEEEPAPEEDKDESKDKDKSKDKDESKDEDKDKDEGKDKKKDKKKDKDKDKGESKDKDKGESKDKDKSDDAEAVNTADQSSDSSKEKKPAGPEITVLTTYRYEDLPQPLDRVRNYCELLTAEDFGFVPVDEKIMKSKMPTFEESAGSLRLVRPITAVVEGEEGEKPAEPAKSESKALFSLEISWEGEQCSVTVGRIEGGIVAPPQPKPMTLHEAMEYFYNRHPSQLGLPGESMRDYRVYPLDGMVMVGTTACMQLNVYSIDPETGTTEIAGQYLMAPSGVQLYHIGSDGQLEELAR